MTAITPSRLRHVDIALLVLRIAIGAVFLYHGSQKLFTMGIPAIVNGFTKTGIPLPAVSARLVSYVEFAGGIAALAGVFTRVAAALLAVDMLGAMAFVHFKNGFQLPTGYEFTLTLCCICIAVALTGAGAFSVDAAIARRQR